jgi:two-component system response regulator DesR
LDAPRIKVLCVDDSARLTAAWQRLFQRQPDLEMVASLPSADDLVATVKDRKPDVVLMDLTMAGRDPLDAMSELARVEPDVRVLVCTGLTDPVLVERAMDAGAWGFVTKVEDPDRIIDAIRRVARGQVVIPGAQT